MSCQGCAERDRKIADLTEDLSAWRDADRRRAGEVKATQRLADWRTTFGLTATETLLLLALVDRGGLLLSREAAMAALSGTFARVDEPDYNIVSVYLSRVRIGLRSHGFDGAITTTWGQGWSISSAKIGALTSAVDVYVARQRGGPTA